MAHCLTLFFAKSVHVRYRRDFAQRVIEGMMASVKGSNKDIDWMFVKFVVDVYQGPIQAMVAGRM